MKRNLKIILAPDSFKESMTSQQVCDALEKGIKKVDGSIECVKIPMADGGEGTMESLVASTGGRVYSESVLDPLGRTIEAKYGILGCGDIAVLEMASASGLHLVERELRNPLITTTYGTGQLIKACLNHPIKTILIGIGGSATNDGGAGMFQALGGKLLDGEGNDLPFGGGTLEKLSLIDDSQLDPRLKEIRIEVACDVDNPLLGSNGASHVYGPQKGATQEMVHILDRNLEHFGQKVEEYFNISMMEYPGSGAAGGLGAGLMAFVNGKLKSGIDMVIKYTELEKHMQDADMVWTGEGALDIQTANGKTPYGVAKVAKKYHVPVIAIAGHVSDNLDSLYECGIDSIFSVMQGVSALDEALKNGPTNVEKTSENIMRLIKAII